MVHTSVVKKSAAAIAPQWAARNVRQDSGRSGTGPIPSACRIVATVDRAEAPRRILTRHLNGQLADLAEHARSSDTSSLSGPLTRDELPMPPQDRVRCDQRRHLTQGLSSETMAIHGEPTPLDIGQPKTSPVQVLLEDAVLLP